MTFHPARHMHGVVQNPERHEYSVPRTDMTRPSDVGMSGCVNLIAAYGEFRLVSVRARTVLRHNVKRIDAIMIMRRTPRFRLRCSDPPKAACSGKRRHSKTHISRRFHHIVPRAEAM